MYTHLRWSKVLTQYWVTMKYKMKLAFMDVACRFGDLSHANRLKVGSVIVKDERIISIGYNGMPTGWDNECEHDGKTKPEVLHSEANAILKVARSTDSTVGASIFCSHTPCIECAKLIYQSGITHVYTRFEYDAAKGCGEKFLEDSGIPVEMISPVD